ncbi:hypothetical protein D3C80_1920550 [compost metagenome]
MVMDQAPADRCQVGPGALQAEAGAGFLLGLEDPQEGVLCQVSSLRRAAQPAVQPLLEPSIVLGIDLTQIVVNHGHPSGRGWHLR